MDQQMKKFTAARQQDALLEVQWYCQNSDCPAREVEVFIKDYDNSVGKEIERGTDET